MHLDYAERMAQSPRLGASALAALQSHWSAYYLGSIAADYQSICDVPRQVTHFYPVPLLPAHDTIATLFETHPALQDGSAIESAKAVFMAGYLAHLNFDVVWYREILVPFFTTGDQWGDIPWRERFTFHNVLLTFLDKRSLDDVPDSAEKTLAQAASPTDIEFIEPTHLNTFQSMLVAQLAPGATIRTVEVYAERMGLSPAEFGQHLEDDQWMQSKLFNRVPLDTVLAILERTVHDSAELITAYLNSHP